MLMFPYSPFQSIPIQYPLKQSLFLFCQSFFCPLQTFIINQFSSVAQLCLTLWYPVDCSTPGLPVHHQHPEFTPTQVHWAGDAIQPSHPHVVPFSSCPQSFPASESFQMSQLFASDGQSIGVSASASVFSINIQEWFPLWLTGWISLQSRGPSRIFSNTTVKSMVVVV